MVGENLRKTKLRFKDLGLERSAGMQISQLTQWGDPALSTVAMVAMKDMGQPGVGGLCHKTQNWK